MMQKLLRELSGRQGRSVSCAILRTLHVVCHVSLDCAPEDPLQSQICARTTCIPVKCLRVVVSACSHCSESRCLSFGDFDTGEHVVEDACNVLVGQAEKLEDIAVSYLID